MGKNRRILMVGLIILMILGMALKIISGIRNRREVEQEVPVVSATPTKIEITESKNIKWADGKVHVYEIEVNFNDKTRDFYPASESELLGLMKVDANFYYDSRSEKPFTTSNFKLLASTEYEISNIDFEDEHLSAKVLGVKDELLPYLINNYCQKNSDCSVRVAESCTKAPLNYYGSYLKFGCGEQVCQDKKYTGVAKCVDNKCTASFVKVQCNNNQ